MGRLCLSSFNNWDLTARRCLVESHCLSEFTVMHSVRKWDISKAFALQISPNPAFFFCFFKCYVETKKESDIRAASPANSEESDGARVKRVPAAAGHPEKQSLCHRAARFQSALLVTELLGTWVQIALLFGRAWKDGHLNIPLCCRSICLHTSIFVRFP